MSPRGMSHSCCGARREAGWPRAVESNAKSATEPSHHRDPARGAISHLSAGNLRHFDETSVGGTPTCEHMAVLPPRPPSPEPPVRDPSPAMWRQLQRLVVAELDVDPPSCPTGALQELKRAWSLTDTDSLTTAPGGMSGRAPRAGRAPASCTAGASCCSPQGTRAPHWPTADPFALSELAHVWPGASVVLLAIAHSRGGCFIAHRHVALCQ